MSEIIKGSCEATQSLKKLVDMVSNSNSTVLLRGETVVVKILLQELYMNHQKEKVSWLM